MTTTSRTIFPKEKPHVERTLTLRRIWPVEQLPYNAGDARTFSNSEIPKPRGEVSRLKRGGYSLKAALGWDDEFYHAVQTYISTDVRQNLPNLPYIKQSSEEVGLLCKKIAEKFPILERYHNHWATRDFIRGTLKNGSRSRQTGNK